MLYLTAFTALCLGVGAAGVYAMPVFAQEPSSTPVTSTTGTPPDPCICDQPTYSCSSFSNWSAAQACFNQCRITAGYDIHGLDEDGDGVACEMTIEGPSPFTLPTPPASSAPLPDANATPGGALAPPLIQTTTTTTLPILPTLSMPMVTSTITGGMGTELPGAGVTGTGITGTGLPGAGVTDTGLPETGVTGTGVTGTGVTGAGLTGTGVTGSGPPGAGVTATEGGSTVETVTELPAYLEDNTPGTAGTPVRPGVSASLALRVISVFIVLVAAVLVWLRRRG